jgi:hypothetical protein
MIASRSIRVGRDEILEQPGALQFLERLRLDLTEALPGDAQRLCHLTERLVSSFSKPGAHPQDFFAREVRVARARRARYTATLCR